MSGLIRYLGGKHRMARHIAERLHATGADCLVEVFGGSAAVMLHAGYEKRVYNDASDDLVTLFRVLADPERKRLLHRQLRFTPPARRIFQEDYAGYVRNGLSFSHITNPVDRARAVFYRHQYVFGGKVRSGGFSVSTGNRFGIKEVRAYRNTLRRLAHFARFFRETVIECLDYQDCCSRYGRRANCVLYVDPPYVGTENMYSHLFGRADHVFLAELLSNCAASVVLTYYDHPLIRQLYPDARWQWEAVVATRNSQFVKGNKAATTEWIITRRHA